MLVRTSVPVKLKFQSVEPINCEQNIIRPSIVRVKRVKLLLFLDSFLKIPPRESITKFLFLKYSRLLPRYYYYYYSIPA